MVVLIVPNALDAQITAETRLNCGALLGSALSHHPFILARIAALIFLSTPLPVFFSLSRNPCHCQKKMPRVFVIDGRIEKQGERLKEISFG